jgi:1-phosphatidylinositol-3-phosphate 5-kinase
MDPPQVHSGRVPDRHPLLTCELKYPLASAIELQTLLADFRARGGLTKKNADAYKDLNPVIRDYDLLTDGSEAESLITKGCRRIPLLYCSYSLKPGVGNFCEGPYVKAMEFNGPDDLSLRSFLEKYCFNADDKCHHQGCSSSIFEHKRKYCHSRGSIEVTQKQQKDYAKFASTDIVTWTVCESCQCNSAYRSLSHESWGMSFAKFIQLKIYSQEYLSKPCHSPGHKCHGSLFMDRVQYFAYKNLVALFEYKPLALNEIRLPSQSLQIHLQSHDMDTLREEMKRITMNGLDVQATVHEKIVSLREEMAQTSLATTINEFAVMEEKDRFEIRKKASDVNEDLCEDNVTVETKIRIMDDLFLLNQLIASYTQNWTLRIQELLTRRKEERAQLKSLHSVSSQNSLSHPTRQSSSSANDSVFLAGDTSFSRSSSFSQIQEEMDNQKTLTQNDVSSFPARLPTVKDDVLGDGLSDFSVQIGITDSPSSTSLSSMDEVPVPGASNLDLVADKDDEDVCDSGSKRPETSSSRPSTAMRRNISVHSQIKTFVSSIFEKVTFEVDSPFLPSEHYLLNINPSIPVLVCDDDPGSVIAYVLASSEYKELLDHQLAQSRPATPDRLTNSFASILESDESNPVDEAVEPQMTFNSGSAVFSKNETPKSAPSQTPNYVEIEFSDSSSKFNCRCYFPQKFAELRAHVLTSCAPADAGSISTEELFIRSIAKGVPWKALGGKSKSAFRKTRDDRFVLKEMTKTEIQSFETIATFYFDYMSEALTAPNKTVLAKILGVYKISNKSIITGNAKSIYLLVMENLFYNRKIVQKFDLKGSARNRLADTNTEDEVVLLDENLVNMIRESPFYVRSEDKRILMAAIKSDTQFLTAHELLDYSLLVGIDEVAKEFVVGIIDYIRSFTWDKRVEMVFKSSLPAKEKPTILKPESYRERYIAKMDKYFLTVPDPACNLELESRM